ncbi:hypothetical protein KEM54_004259 [Ascosphaera aggregata]|nr:hypothetical protein KEM54_004259 [Ascosphaera aggregata]
MEELEVHSKSYLVRWIYVKPKHSISWSIQPHKKSLNFGIFKHAAGNNCKSLSVSSDASILSDPARDRDGGRPGSVVPAPEKLKSIGMKQVVWIGRCDADKIAQGTYAVGDKPEDAGNYGLVFDNTFSKTVSKTVTFVLLTYPTDNPPHWNHQIHHSQAISHCSHTCQSTTELPSANVGGAATAASAAAPAREPSGSNGSLADSASTQDNSKQRYVHTGILQKRRRKKHQGYARRYFSLDFETQTLSYFHDRNSSAMRGTMPLDFAAVAHDDFHKEFSIDSGAEIWHLRALNSQSYESWKRALKKASNPKKATTSNGYPSELSPNASEAQSHQRTQSTTQSRAQSRVHSRAHSRNPSYRHSPADIAADMKSWSQIESAYAKITRSRDVARRLAKDTDSKYLSSPAPQTKKGQKHRGRSPSPLPRASTAHLSADYADNTDSSENTSRRSFWKIKQKDAPTPPTPESRRTSSGQHSTAGPSASHLEVSTGNIPESTMHQDLLGVLNDLDAAVAELAAVLEYRKLTLSAINVGDLSSRQEFDSEDEDEFFDALDETESPLLVIQTDASDIEETETTHERAPSVYEEEVEVDPHESSDTDGSDDEDAPSTALNSNAQCSLFPAKPKSLTPLPLQRVKRRNGIPPPAVQPPSLISFLRRNVGKDLSTISMPVSANEPISLLQRAAEQLEYSLLLDKAASATDGVERLIYVTAFAISPLSGVRLKERAARKPFNPMLGETYELIREDSGFRFISEKVSHRPLQLAFQADSRDWSLSQSPKPTQQFWGKSAEIITEGKLRLSLHTHGERYSWSTASCSLRNIIAGEKYIEPTGEMVVLNETTGEKTVTTFKAGGLFSGRSEELHTKTFDSHGKPLPLGLQGTWPESVRLTENGNLTNTVIWSAGPLVKHPQKHWGYTQFAASLNEITSTEKNRIPPTDSRLRPDQRALEEGNVDGAEELKEKLEVAQRVRRRDMETKGETWTPRWFTKLEGDLAGTEDVWKIKTGKEGYWEERTSGKWTGVVPVLNV